MKFGRWGKREVEATNNWGRIWQFVQATWREVTCQSCHIQHSWLLDAWCWMATILFYTPNNSKPCLQIWGTGRSWLISSKKSHWKEPYILRLMFKCTVDQHEFDQEYMGLSTQGWIIIDPIYGQILYNCWLSNSFKLKYGHNLKLLLIEMKWANGG